MKFGLYSSIANPPRGEHLDRCVDEVIAEAQQAEASGLDSCFCGEHHQDKDGFLPSPLIVPTAVAARTCRLRVGASVTCSRSTTRYASGGISTEPAPRRRPRRGAGPVGDRP